VTQRLLWWFSTGRPGYPTKLPCYGTRFTSSSVNALKHIGGVCLGWFQTVLLCIALANFDSDLAR
jgi:hypothetical protein